MLGTLLSPHCGRRLKGSWSRVSESGSGTCFAPCAAFWDLPELLSVSWLSTMNDKSRECFASTAGYLAEIFPSHIHDIYLTARARRDLLRLYNNITCTGDEGEISTCSTVQNCSKSKHNDRGMQLAAALK